MTSQELTQAVRHDCTCGGNPLLPQICQVTDIWEETHNIKTFRIKTLGGKKPFEPQPGQLAMISLLPVGEGMFSVTAEGEDYLDFAIKSCGMLTDALHEILPGQEIGVRGPYGNTFPTEAAKGKNLLFIGRGIGLAPVRSFIRYVLAHRAGYGKVDIIGGARMASELCFKEDLFENWPQEPNTKVHITVDRCEENWQGSVCFLPDFIENMGLCPDNTLVVMCAPPIIGRYTLAALKKIGFAEEQIFTTLEMRMKCGIGKCGRCNIGSKYVCLDGPVFSLAELKDLPDEY